MKRLLPLLSVCSLCFVGHLAAADIVALCIGNNAYVTPEDVLDTPVNDARLMHQTLRAVPGVQAADIVLLEDAKRSQITLALRQFKARAEGAKLALIFYSGHGVEDTPTGYDRAETFLLPVDAVIDSADDLPDKAVPLKTVLEALEGTRGAARGVILDCCRSGAPGATKSLARAGKNLSALDESVKKALGGAILPEGTLIAFAASPGRKAAAFLTEADTNSPFTRFISEQMSSQGGDLFSIVNAASRITKQRTEMRQVPHVELRGDASLITDFAIPASSLVKLTPSPVVPRTTEPADPLASVSKLTPFTNTLGMKFVHAGTPGVLFSVWETRVQDFEAFVEETNHDAIADSSFGSPAYTLEKAADGKDVEWAPKGGSWRDPRFPMKQSGEHPVVCVSYLDAEAFCAWLTKRDRAAGTIPPNASYRLPTDAEWSRAVGSSKYPWGDTFPPGNEDGNYSGKEAMVGALEGFSDDLVKAGRRDSGARTATVGLFKENSFGLHDMGGNVAEWCSTWFTADLNEDAIKETFPMLKDDKGRKTYRVLLGSSWNDSSASVLLSSFRLSDPPGVRNDTYGFRLVLVVGSGG